MKKEEPRTIAETVAFNIKKYRKNLGMTQENLAAAIKTTKSAISKYELGRRFPDADTMDDLAKALGISPLFLIADEETAERTLETLNHGSRQSTPEHRRELEKMMGKEEGYLEENAVQQMRRTREEQLLTAYGKLNDFGQAVALVDVERLSTQEKYTDSLEPRTDEERALVEEGRLAELWEKRYSGPQEPPAAPSEGTDTAPTENASTGPQDAK